MARFYNIPSGGYIGLTNSKINDAQSGFETSMSVVAGYLGGVNIFNMGGLLDALMAFDFAKAVIDNDIAMMLKRIRRGFEFKEEDLSLDLIARVGPGGMYADLEHTLDRMRTAMYLTEIADRDPREQWQENGAQDAQARAMIRVKDILTRDNPADFSPEVDAQIRSEFVGMISGKSVPPEGWKASVKTQAKGRESRQERRRRLRQKTTTN
jgi:trimethylamine--corrinoid protein Co-methyltransferase